MKRNAALLVCLAVMAFTAAAGTVRAQDDIRARMHGRLPAIVALKAAGIVGENNRGYLTALKPAGDKQGLIDAENQDRRLIYQGIAKNENTTPELVGSRRALQIAEKADSGTWIQDSAGHWRQK